MLNENEVDGPFPFQLRRIWPETPNQNKRPFSFIVEILGKHIHKS